MCWLYLTSAPSSFHVPTSHALPTCVYERYDQTTILDSSGSITSHRRRKGCNLLFGQIFLKTAWKWRKLACILKLNFHWKHKVFVSLDKWTSTAAQIKISQGSCTSKIPVPVALVCAAGDCAVLFLCRPIYSLIFLFLHLYFVGFLSIWQPERTNIRMSLFSYRNCVQWFKCLALRLLYAERKWKRKQTRFFFL